MAVMTVRLSDDQHARLKTVARQKGISLNKLFEELSTRCIAEHDTELRFRLRASRGNPERGLAILDKLDRAHETDQRT